ncbi:MAG: hypothetical protein RL134_578 [Actinomycetota bacterium]|jgi:hypothetical protein
MTRLAITYLLAMGEDHSMRGAKSDPATDDQVSVVLAELAEIRSRSTPGPESLRELIEMGRH